MSTANKVQVTVGSLADMGKRFAGAWNQAAAGERVEETHVTFLDVQTMLDTLSPRRLELLRFVRQHGAGTACWRRPWGVITKISIRMWPPLRPLGSCCARGAN